MNKDQIKKEIEETSQVISKLNDETEFNNSVLKIIKDLGLDKANSGKSSPKIEDKVARQAEL